MRNLEKVIFSDSSHQWVLCLLFLITVVSFAPYFLLNITPVHDSSLLYHDFHNYYNGFFFNKELPLWYPYMGYGIPSLFIEFNRAAPFLSFAGFLGYIFEVKNTLILFKFGILCGVLIYVYGLYALGRSLYKSHISILFICLIGVLTVSWVWQPWFNLTIFYLMPLTISFLIRFYQSANPNWLWMSIITFAVNCIGNITYFCILQGYLLLLLFAMLALFKKELFKCIIDRKFLLNWNAIVFIALCSMFFYITVFGLEGVVGLAPARDPVTLKVSRDVFITYGRLSPGITFFGFMTGGILSADNTYYIGLFSLILFLYGLFRVRSPLFISFLAAIAFLFALSLGGIFSQFIYYFPGMSMYRHIGLTFGLCSLLLIICAGMVLDDILNKKVHRRTVKYGKTICVIAFLIIIDMIFSWSISDFGYHLWRNWPEFYGLLFFRLFLVASFLLLMHQVRHGRCKVGSRAMLLFFFLVVVLDVGSFYWKMIDTVSSFRTENTDASATSVSELPFINRSMTPQTNRAVSFFNSLPQSGALYDDASHLFSHNDPCFPTMRLNFISKYVGDEITRNGGNMFWLNKEMLGENSKNWDIVRCNMDKISITNGSYKVRSFSTNHLELDLTVDGDDGGILYYADSYHPRWRAYVDNREVDIRNRNGFKEISVTKGKHLILFKFGTLFDYIVGYALIAIGILFTSAILFIMVFSLIRMLFSLKKV